jgi:release factor glutamine methyltransferase
MPLFLSVLIRVHPWLCFLPLSDEEFAVTTEKPWTIAALLDWTTRYLEGKGAESARLEAQLLLAHALGYNRTQLYMHPDEIPAEESRARFRELVQQRVKGKPVAYLLGRKEFFSLEFEVTPAVLIPRPDTEWLATECVKRARSLGAPRILDVGTGSGCLAVALAQQLEQAQVTATDLSAEALEVARRNAARHKVAERIRFFQGDLLDAVPPGETFDFIVSNPPYIPSAVIDQLDPDVREHEPRLALDGGPDGFLVFDRLIDQTPARLVPGGWLLVEIGAEQEQEGRNRLARIAGYQLGATVRDLAGRPRVLPARWQPTAGDGR